MRQYSVYVVELGDDAGPRINPIKPRVYVGYTEKSPEQRLTQHKLGGRLKNKAAPRVYRYGTRLRPKLYSRLSPVGTIDEAERLEAWLARRLLKPRVHRFWRRTLTQRSQRPEEEVDEPESLIN